MHAIITNSSESRRSNYCFVFFHVCFSSCCRLVRVSAGEIEKLTPLIIQATRDFRANPRDLVAVERLQTIGREWASKVHVLSGAVDEIVTPWSAAASKLALAATSGDAEELKKQVDYFFDGIYT